MLSTTTEETPVANKQQQKPRSLHYNDLAGALWLTVGGKEYGYWLDRLPNRWDGCLAVKLSKFRCQQEPDGVDGYEVRIDRQSEEGQHSCECKGFYWRSSCKHVDAIKKLVELGRLI